MYFAIWLLTSFQHKQLLHHLRADADRSESVHTVTRHAPDAEGISLSSTGLIRHFQFCFTFLLVIKCCSCFLSNYNVSLVLLYSPQQSRCSSHAPTSCLLEIILSGFPMFSPKDWDTFSSLLFLSYHMCFPHTFSKFATKIVRCATQQQSEQSFLELLWKHKNCWKSFLATHASSPAAWGTAPEAAIIMPCLLSH